MRSISIIIAAAAIFMICGSAGAAPACRKMPNGVTICQFTKEVARYMMQHQRGPIYDDGKKVGYIRAVRADGASVLLDVVVLVTDKQVEAAKRQRHLAMSQVVSDISKITQRDSCKNKDLRAYFGYGGSLGMTLFTLNGTRLFSVKTKPCTV